MRSTDLYSRGHRDELELGIGRGGKEGDVSIVQYNTSMKAVLLLLSLLHLTTGSIPSIVSFLAASTSLRPCLVRLFCFCFSSPFSSAFNHLPVYPCMYTHTHPSFASSSTRLRLGLHVYSVSTLYIHTYFLYKPPLTNSLAFCIFIELVFVLSGQDNLLEVAK